MKLFSRSNSQFIIKPVLQNYLKQMICHGSTFLKLGGGANWKCTWCGPILASWVTKVIISFYFLLCISVTNLWYLSMFTCMQSCCKSENSESLYTRSTPAPKIENVALTNHRKLCLGVLLSERNVFSLTELRTHPTTRSWWFCVWIWNLCVTVYHCDLQKTTEGHAPIYVKSLLCIGRFD